MADVSAGIAVLEPGDIRELFDRLCDAFTIHRVEVDELNIFPVPDGDTGTNLLLTVRAALEHADAANGTGDGDHADSRDPSEDAQDAVQALVRGTVMGARGNSGVILSQVMRALAETMAARGALDVLGIATWLEGAREHAYAAVADPVEGTMLTAVAAAAERARRAAADDEDLATATGAIVDAVSAAVARTPEQLEVLADAGVVDAGARGFEVFCTALDRVARGEDPAVDRPPPMVARTGPVATREAGSLEYRFEVQYLLRSDGDADADVELRGRLEDIGDSVMLSRIGDLLNVHVHTNEIGAAIEAGSSFGEPSRIQVTSFADQIAAHAAGQVADRGSDGAGDDGRRPPTDVGSAAAGAATDPEAAAARLGCVAVVAGDGLRELVEAHGALALEGAAGTLPSVASLLEGIGRAAGEAAVVLPGHPNVVPGAWQAAQVSRGEGGCEVHVVDAAVSPSRVLAALAVWDPDGEADVVVEAMGQASASGTSGEVVAAVRDAEIPVGTVREGGHLAVRDGEVIGHDADPIAALTDLARACTVDRAEVVTLIVGADVADAERRRAVAALEELAPEVHLEVIDGGQRPARYHLGVE